MSTTIGSARSESLAGDPALIQNAEQSTTKRQRVLERLAIPLMGSPRHAAVAGVCATLSRFPAEAWSLPTMTAVPREKLGKHRRRLEVPARMPSLDDSGLDPIRGDQRHPDGARSQSGHGQKPAAAVDRRLLSPGEAATYLGLGSRFAIYRLVTSGVLPAVRLANKVRVDVQDLDALIDNAKTGRPSGSSPCAGDLSRGRPVVGILPAPDPVTPVCLLADELAPAMERAIEAHRETP